MVLDRLQFLILAPLAGLWMIAPSAVADPNSVVPAMGHDLAQHFCTTCHVIERGMKNPPDFVGGPSFQSVADRPDTSKDSLLHHLRTTHTNKMLPLAMPNPELSHDEMVKIVSYILSLRQQP